MDYHTTYHWDLSGPTPVLFARVSGTLLANPDTIPTIIDETHSFIDDHPDLDAITLVYDITDTEGRLPLASLMRRQVVSSRVKRVIVAGARSRTDEMAILIMSAAKVLPYEFIFTPRPLEDDTAFSAR